LEALFHSREEEGRSVFSEKPSFFSKKGWCSREEKADSFPHDPSTGKSRGIPEGKGKCVSTTTWTSPEKEKESSYHSKGPYLSEEKRIVPGGWVLKRK